MTLPLSFRDALYLLKDCIECGSVACRLEAGSPALPSSLLLAHLNRDIFPPQYPFHATKLSQPSNP
jgi:hypothetical protein